MSRASWAKLRVEERRLPQVMNGPARVLPPARPRVAIGVAIGGQTQAQQYLNRTVDLRGVHSTSCSNNGPPPIHEEIDHAIPSAHLPKRTAKRQRRGREARRDARRVPDFHGKHRQVGSLQGRQRTAADQHGHDGASSQRQATSNRRPIRRGPRATRRLLSGGCQGSRRSDRHRGADPGCKDRLDRGASDLEHSDAVIVALEQEIGRLYKEESRRILATLIRLLGDFDIAEEALQDAFAVAVEQWARDGVPANPRTWLVSTGRHRAIDRMRRDARFVAQPDDVPNALAVDAPEP